MVDSEIDYEVLVWTYGTRCAEIPEEADRQLRLAHELRERLVELVLERNRAAASAWETQPDLVVAIQTRDDVRTLLGQTLTRAADYRQTTRSRQLSADLREQIAQARADLKQAKARLREAKDRAHPAVAPLIHEARLAERKAQKATYAEFVQHRGLYWATYNRVLEQHRRASSRVMRQRAAGHPAALRHHRFDGTGLLAFQLQRRKDEPLRTADLLSDPSSPWSGIVVLPSVCATQPGAWAALTRSERRLAGRVQVRVRLTGGRQPAVWNVPVQIHRPIPEGAEIVAGEIVVTRVADRRRTTLHLTLRSPRSMTANGGAVAVDIGWRAMPDHSIRVGYWCADRPPPEQFQISEHVRDLVILSRGGREGEIRFPTSWRRLDERIRAVRSRRDEQLNRLKVNVVSWLCDRPSLAVALHTSPQAVARWRSPARMVSFARQLAEHQAEADLLAEIGAWERWDRRLWQWEANERDQLTARRRDAYRAVAALLTEAWPHVILQPRAAARFTRRPPKEETDSPQAERARRQARLVAPTELADAIAWAARRRGGSVTEVDPSWISRRHYICGNQIPTDVATSGVLVHCPTCKLPFDQDQNAVLNMLSHVKDHAGPLEATSGTL